MNRIYLFLSVLLFSIFWGTSLFANPITSIEKSSSVIEFSIFSRPDCIHCIELKNFLDITYPAGSPIQPKYYDINIPENNELYHRFTDANNLSKVTPIILVGNEIIEWFGWAETTGKMIQETTNSMTKSSLFEDKIEALKTHKWWEWCSADAPCVIPPKRLDINLPFIGVVNLREYSLPILAVVLGFVDGFNPCAMWVLVMFLTILMQTGSRKKMFQIAGIFILAEAIMYYMILNVWYKTWDFIKLDHIITPIIWVISLAAGGYFIYEFFTNKDGECKVTSNEHKRKTTEKIKKMVNAPMTLAVFFATIGIAFSVNIIEFACSIGIPQAFTKLLEMSSITGFMKQMYILLYTFFYMFDDFVVFWIALYAFHYLHLTTKYTRYCLMIGGVIMLILGYFFLFDPIALKMIIA